ncbi:MAG: PQQ-dependent sugar dehydrogenase [Myxococcales bacterium]|nr:PQQ-dependent sugar dehydrogenase [Myxococcales bacterium]
MLATLAALAVLSGAGVLIGWPYIRSAWYVYQDIQIFSEANIEEASHGVKLPLADPASTNWRMVAAFPEVNVVGPTVALFQPSGEVFVLERAGRIVEISGLPGQRTTRVLLDFTAKVGLVEHEEGAVGMVLHPDFGQPTEQGHHIFVYYTSRSGDRKDRLERYSFDQDFRTILPESGLVMIDQSDEHSDHNGGDLHFASDGFLYLTIGDEGNCECNNNQRIDKDLFGGILRIDVDRHGGDISHPPPKQPQSGKTAGYFIPNDNPFVGVSGALEEFYSIGLRNPYRFTIDPVTQRILGGDVGRLRMESIFEAKKGTNHRWSHYEGFLEHRNTEVLPERRPGIWTEPIFAYPHENMNHAVIGGRVYRGKLAPELTGKYVYGDNSSGRLWALDLSSKENRFLAAIEDRGDRGLAGFAVDREGELYALALGSEQSAGQILRLSPTRTESDASSELQARVQTDGGLRADAFDEADAGVGGHVSAEAHPGLKPLLPQTLSEVGFFGDLKKLVAPGAIRYSLNLPMWRGTPGLAQTNWALALRPKSRVRFAGKGKWQTPGGLLFVKHMAVNERPVETQFLVKTTAGEGYGLSYAWRPDGADADLVTESRVEQVGDARWNFGASSDCNACHTKSNGFVLGISTRQLNRGNQLVELRRQGFFEPRTAYVFRMWGLGQPRRFLREMLEIHQRLQKEPLVQPSRVENYANLVPPEANASLEERVRSYMDVNCAHCHQPGGSGGGGFDARYEVSLADKGIVGKPASRPIDDADILVAPGDPERSLLVKRISSAQPGVQMPPIGVSAPDEAAVEMFRQWIMSLD